jgi:hypothetical protein
MSTPKTPKDLEPTNAELYNTRQRIDESEGAMDTAGVESLKGWDAVTPPTLTSDNKSRPSNRNHHIENAHDKREADTRADSTRGYIVRGEKIEIPDMTDRLRKLSPTNTQPKSVPEFQHKKDAPQKLNPDQQSMNDNAQDTSVHDAPEPIWPRRGL